MQLLPPPYQQGVVGHVLDEGVLEHIRQFGEETPLVDQFKRLEFLERGLGVGPQLGQAVEETTREFASDDRGELEEPLRGVGEAVDAGHNDVLDGVRNDHLLDGPGQDRLLSGLANGPYVLQRFHDLLHKEGIPLRALGDQALECCRETLGGKQCLRHLDAVSDGKCRQGDPGIVRTFLKGVDIPGAVRQDTEHPGAGKTVREERQKCLGGLIHPLQILKDHDLWAHCRSADDDVPHGVKDLATALLRVHAWHQWAWINGQEIVQIRQTWTQVFSEMEDTLGNLVHHHAFQGRPLRC